MEVVEHSTGTVFDISSGQDRNSIAGEFCSKS